MNKRSSSDDSELQVRAKRSSPWPCVGGLTLTHSARRLPQMISKLKTSCGTQFTSKMEGMLNDLKIGSDHKEEWHKYVDSQGGKQGLTCGIEFEVTMLTTGFWPKFGAGDEVAKITLPEEMLNCTTRFVEWYEDKNQRRKVSGERSSFCVPSRVELPRPADPLPCRLLGSIPSARYRSSASSPKARCTTSPSRPCKPPR